MDTQAPQVQARPTQPPQSQISLTELVKLCAVDTELFGRTFFPRTFRQTSPPFARQMWEPFDNPASRLVNTIAFRGSSKTTRLRVFGAKRISYGVSRTILWVGASQPDAIRSVTWLRNQVERNAPWAGAFNLRPGKKWEETQIEIEHGTFGHTIWVLGAGITGSLRGINFDDYRPDLIVLDDPQTDETAATEDQREKLADLILGAVRNSLAPASEEPNAKMVMNITPQHKDDVSQRAANDPQWTTQVYPCWTKETLLLPVEKQESSWPARFPSETLRKEKMDAVRVNKLSIFTREMECRLSVKEKNQFRPQWLTIREAGIVPPRGLYSVLAIDPVPPPSPRQVQKGLEGKDFEAHYVWGRNGDKYELLEWRRNRGHQPSWSIATALELARRWRVGRANQDGFCLALRSLGKI